MIRIMVVGDGPMIREGIVRTVDWESLDMQMVGTTGNGRDGMAKALTEKSDIVITGIRMPIVDGIRLAKELKEKLPKIRVVFLTGYSGFEYARETIRLGAADYLLKPINTEDLTRLIRKLANQARQESATVVSRAQKTVLLKESLPMMRNRCVERYFQGGIGETTSIKQTGALGMDSSGQEHQIIISYIDHYYQPIANGERKAGLLKYAMSNTTEEVLGACGSAVICDKGGIRVMMILDTDQETERITRCCKEIQFCMRKYYRVSISVDVGRKAKAVQDPRIPYQSADGAMEEGIKQGSNQITAREGNPRNGSKHVRLFLTPGKEQEINDAVRLLDKNKVYDVLGMVFQEYVMEQDLGRRGAEQPCMHLMLIAVCQLEHSSVLPEQMLGKNCYYYNEIPRYETVQDLEMWMKGICSEFLAAVDRRNSGKYRGIVVGGLAHVMEHFSKSIQVGDVAQTICVTPNCFSRVFKEETDENFIDWLSKYRIGQARRRMDMEPEIKAYAIIEEIGLSDYKYFAFIFRKYTGSAPISYRNY